MLLTMTDQQRIEAAHVLLDSRLSERQVWRLLARTREEGLTGLLHGNRGRAHQPL